MKINILAAILLLVFTILAVSGLQHNSVTCDEMAHHIPVGYVLLTKWDFKMDTSQPPLPRYIVALPLKLFMKLNMPDDKNEWRRPDRSSFGRDFFYKYNKDQLKMVLFARIPVILIGILCGLLLFKWASSLYGDKAGLLGLFLYCLSPNILAHSALATTDMVVAFFMTLSVYTFWLFLCGPSSKRTLIAGACLGLAQLSKYSALLLYPIFLLLIFFQIPATAAGKRAGLFMKYAAVVIISLIVIWGGYGFDLQPILKDTMRTGEKRDIANNISSKLPAVLKNLHPERFLLETPVPLGAHILGTLGIMRHEKEGHSTYFLGRWSSQGKKAYFLLAFLIKNPIPMLIFLLLGLIVTFRNKIGKGEEVILTTLILFFLAASFSNLQTGLRHILPLFPLCFVIAGRSAVYFKKMPLRIAALSLIIWQIISTLVAWPNYLSYFNELIGGPKNGYKYLREANLDWGQGLPSLSDYMVKYNVAQVALEYFGQADPSVYGVRYRRLKPDEFERPDKDIYAISAQYLDHVKWAKDREPTAMAGYSIFIYDLREEKAKK